MHKREAGSILVGLMVVMAVMLIMLISLQGSIRQELFLTRKTVLAVLGVLDRESEFFNIGVEVLGRQMEHNNIVGIDERCSLFGRDVVAGDEERVHISRLSGACYAGSARILHRIYNIDKRETGITEYLYIYKDQKSIDSNYIGRSQLTWGVDGLNVLVEFEGRRYTYQLERLSFNAGFIRREAAHVLGSVSEDGFYLRMENDLWLLPFDENQGPRLLGGLGIGLRVIMVDFIVNRQLNILVADNVSGDAYSRMFTRLYSLDAALVVIKSEQSEGRGLRDISLESYQVRINDQYGVVLEGVIDGGNKLLAIDWGGAPLWQNRYLWGKRTQVECGLETTYFEPVEGWVLGCWRKASTKVGVI